MRQLNRVGRVCAVALTAFILSGCGPHVEIEYHFNTPREVIEAKGYEETIGYAEYRYLKILNYEFAIHCDIYLLPLELYQTDACYQATLKHEQRHCYEQEYHAKGQGIIPECPFLKERKL